MKKCGCKGKCHCNEIVYPTKEKVKHTHSEEKVRLVHPSHTRVINHHTIKNEHYYPHSTSYEERVREEDVRGATDRRHGGYRDGYGDVAGARDKHCGGYGPGYVGGARGGCGCHGRCHCSCRRRRRGGFWW